jgi:Na+/H+ antiporter NhaD/arsenite permease-like protein
MEIDYFTLLLLAGLFVVIAGITRAGVVDKISKLFVRVSVNMTPITMASGKDLNHFQKRLDCLRVKMRA